MLNRYQFEVLTSAATCKGKSQRRIASDAGISLGSVNKALHELKDLSYLDADGAVTDLGTAALRPYLVDNAVILAAGAAVRFAPLSFERPKALFEVRGEIVIERMIKQLHEAGVQDVFVVVGYMKEAFFYLEEELGAKIIIAPEYATRNNHSSLYAARGVLGNSYICNSDEYYMENVFSPYVYRPYCSACFDEDVENEYVFDVDASDRITNVARKGTDAYFSRGPAYFDRAFSEQMIGIIEREYDTPEIRGKLWDDILSDHIGDLEIYMRAFEPGIVYEFDYLTDLTAFDRDFFANVDSRILDNICRTLDCTREDITEVVPVKAGLTNLSTLFTAKGVKYMYRHPGNGTEEIVNRKGEAIALGIARELGLDDTFLYEDPDEGWKISVYVEGCSELDYADRGQVERALQMARTLHTSGKTSPYSFDFYDEGANIARLLKEMSYPLPRDFDSLAGRAAAVAERMRPEAGEPVLCHNDFYGPNFLVRGDEMRLIDWEYAAMGDPACDIGNFVAQGSGYSVDETLGILPLYYGREATDAERRHALGAVGVVGWYWYVWAMYKEAMGNPVGEWLYIWYKAAKEFISAAEGLYE